MLSIMADSSRSEAGELFSAVAVQVLYASGLLAAAGDALASVSGHTAARWRVLAALEETPKTVAAIAADLGQARQSVQRVANDLVADGAVRREDNPDDKRADLLELTARGRKALAEIQRKQARWADALGAELGARRIQELSAALQHLTKALEARKEEER
jgi:DNA-binding MarR family transcriptional regulator